MQTDNLNLPYIAPAQAQKHVTHNEALRRLDALVQISVESYTLSQPPESVLDGERYLIPEGPAGEWAGKDHMIAAMQDGIWAYFQAQTGWLVWCVEDEALLVYVDDSWQNLPTKTQNLTQVGINTNADTYNKLAIKSPGALFTHDGSDHRLTVNKNTVGDTASLIFQTGYSGRAEFGLAGDDQFSIKVSADGTAWHEALHINEATGAVSLPNTEIITSNIHNIMKDGGRFAGATVPAGDLIGTFQSPNWLQQINGATFSEYGKFYYNSQTYGGTQPSIDPEIAQLMAPLVGPNYIRYFPEFFVAQITAGSGSSSGVAFPDQTLRYTAFYTGSFPMPPKMTYSYYVKVISGDLGITRKSNSAMYVDGVAMPQDQIIPEDGNWHHILIVDQSSYEEHYRREYSAIRFYMRDTDIALLAFPAAMTGNIKLPSTIGYIPSVHSF